MWLRQPVCRSRLCLFLDVVPTWDVRPICRLLGVKRTRCAQVEFFTFWTRCGLSPVRNPALRGAPDLPPANPLCCHPTWGGHRCSSVS